LNVYYSVSFLLTPLNNLLFYQNDPFYPILSVFLAIKVVAIFYSCLPIFEVGLCTIYQHFKAQTQTQKQYQSALSFQHNLLKIKKIY